MQLIESNRSVTYYLPVPGGAVQQIVLEPHCVNQVPSDVWGALLAKKDSLGESPAARHLAEGITTDITPGRGNAIVAGTAVTSAQLKIVTPAQAAAEEYARVKKRLEKEPDQDVVEILAREEATKAAEQARVRIDPQGPPPTRVKQERGVAYDEESVLPLGATH